MWLAVLDHPLGFALAILAISVVAGLFGSLVGLGGGVIVVPLLTLVLHVDIHYAIGASIVSVIATSSGAAASYVRDEITNLRIGIFLEVATTLGAFLGAVLAAHASVKVLFLLFGVVLALSSLSSIRQPEAPPPGSTPDRLAALLRLSGSYQDHQLGADVDYVARRVPLGFAIMLVAGTLSGLLGIGSGAVKVLAMDQAMGLPIKVSTATSNFMIGVTAAASAGVYFLRGEIEPVIAAPVALGVLSGAFVGSRMMPHMHSETLRYLFVVVAMLIAGQMILRSFGVGL